MGRFEIRWTDDIIELAGKQWKTVSSDSVAWRVLNSDGGLYPTVSSQRLL